MSCIVENGASAAAIYRWIVVTGELHARSYLPLSSSFTQPTLHTHEIPARHNVRCLPHYPLRFSFQSSQIFCFRTFPSSLLCKQLRRSLKRSLQENFVYVGLTKKNCLGPTKPNPRNICLGDPTRLCYRKFTAKNVLEFAAPIYRRYKSSTPTFWIAMKTIMILRTMGRERHLIFS